MRLRTVIVFACCLSWVALQPSPPARDQIRSMSVGQPQIWTGLGSAVDAQTWWYATLPEPTSATAVARARRSGNPTTVGRCTRRKKCRTTGLGRSTRAAPADTNGRADMTIRAVPSLSDPALRRARKDTSMGEIMSVHRNSEGEKITIERVTAGAFKGRLLLCIYDDDDSDDWRATRCCSTKAQPTGFDANSIR